VSAGTSEAQSAAAFDQVSLVSVAANQPPVVSLLTPIMGGVLIEDDDAVITAAASDPDDRVMRVDFLINGELVGSDSTAPYAVTWTVDPDRNINYFTAVAFDDNGASTTSAPMFVITLAKAKPVLTLPDDEIEPEPPDPPGWRLKFEVSYDHLTIERYLLDIYKADTHALALSRDLGKPAVSLNSLINLDLDAPVSALPAGEYEVVVSAVEGAKRTPSTPFRLTR
jgi:hypothetical protein